MLLLLLYGQPLLAMEESGDWERDQPPDQSTGVIMPTWLDTAYQEISNYLADTALRLDAFFGDERVQEERQQTQLNLTISLLVKDGEPPEWTSPIDLNLALPRLESKLQLMVHSLLKESEQESETFADDGPKLTDLNVSVRYKLFQKALEVVSLDGGVKLNVDHLNWETLEPFGVLRIRNTSNFDPWALRLTQFIFWYQQDGLSATSRFDLERRIRLHMLVRISGKVGYAENIQGTQLDHILTFRRQFSHNQALAFESGISGQTSPDLIADEYMVSLTYRRRIYRDWAFFSFTPKAQFYREDHFKIAPSLQCELHIQFKGSPHENKVSFK